MLSKNRKAETTKEPVLLKNGMCESGIEKEKKQIQSFTRSHIYITGWKQSDKYNVTITERKQGERKVRLIYKADSN